MITKVKRSLITGTRPKGMEDKPTFDDLCRTNVRLGWRQLVKTSWRSWKRRILSRRRVTYSAVRPYLNEWRSTRYLGFDSRLINGARSEAVQCWLLFLIAATYSDKSPPHAKHCFLWQLDPRAFFNSTAPRRPETVFHVLLFSSHVEQLLRTSRFSVKIFQLLTKSVYGNATVVQVKNQFIESSIHII